MKGKQCSIQDEDGVPIGIFSFPDNSSLYKEIDMVDNNLKSLKNKKIKKLLQRTARDAILPSR
jgi:hypothetical protein